MTFEQILAIIPCRAGSQRFPNKNVAMYNGLPLVVHKIRQADEALLRDIVVTTNDPAVKEAVGYETGLIINRTADLCTPEATQEDVIEDAIIQGEAAGFEIDTICCLQVTSPTLAVESLVDALNLYEKSTCKSMVAVTETYQPSGGFYIVDKNLFLVNHSLYQEGGHVYVLPPEQCIDIDYKWQLEIAKCLFSGNVFSHHRDYCSCTHADGAVALKLVEIIGPDDTVHYRRPPGHPDIDEAKRTPGYRVSQPTPGWKMENSTKNKIYKYK
jgi:CMP-N-acetylneuraminic acid synthetase